MADLSQLVKSLNIELVTKAKGHKRRAWLTSDIAEVQPSINPDNFDAHSSPIEDTSSAMIPVLAADKIAPLKNTDGKAHNDNGLQIDHKQVTNGLQNRSQIDDSAENRSQIGDTTDHTIDHKQVTNGLQIDHKQVTNSSFIDTSANLKVALSRIQGQERELLFFMFWSTKKTRSRFTESLSLEYIKYSTHINEKSIKTVIHRLVNEKNIVSRHESKKGRGGWTIYQIREDVYNQLLMEEAQREQRINGLQIDHKQVTNGLQIDHKWMTKEVTQQITEPLSGCGIKNTNTTTNTDPTNEFTNDVDYPDIDFKSLRDVGAEFNASHVKALMKDSEISPEDIEFSFDAFWFDLKFNDKKKEIKTNAINFFMGIMRKNKCYIIPQNYKSKRERNLELLTKIRDREKEIEKQEEEVNFNIWLTSISEEQKNEIFEEYSSEEEKESVKKEKFETIKNAKKSLCLKKYYNEKIKKYYNLQER